MTHTKLERKKWAVAMVGIYGKIKCKQCPDCGEDVDDDGTAMIGCYYSPVECKTCGNAPCDESC